MKGAPLLLAALMGIAGCVALPQAPSPPDTADAGRAAGPPSPAARPAPRPGDTPAARQPFTPPARDVQRNAQANAPAARPTQAPPGPVTSAERQQRAAAALAPPPPQACMAPGMVDEIRPLLPAADGDALQRLVADGAALGAERGEWRVGVREAKRDTSRLRMDAPGFGCMNPGLGDGIHVPGRADERSGSYDIDCGAEAKGDGRGITSVFMTPAQRQAREAREAVAARVAQLKAQDPLLTRREQELALAQAQLVQRAARHWQQLPPRTWTMADLARMERFQDQMAQQCTARQARAIPASVALMQEAAQSLPAVFDAALPLHADQVVATLGAAPSGSALRGELKSLFPTPLLERHAQQQPWLVAALQRNGARVATLDAAAAREREAQSAERARRAWELSPVYLARQENLKKAAANTAPTSDEVVALVIDYLIADRENKVADFDRLGNRLSVKVSLPIVGTMQAYLGEVNLISLQCKPRGRSQWCDLEYAERKLVGESSSYEPTGPILRRHGAEFSWSELQGLQSPQLKAAIAQAHKDWHARVNAAMQRRHEIDRAMDMCKDGMPASPTERDRRRCAGRF